MVSLGDIRPWTEVPAPADGANGKELGAHRISQLIDWGAILLYADLGDHQQTWSFSRWRDDTERWTRDVVDALTQIGAIDRAKARFLELGALEHRGFRGIDADHVRLRECLAERLTRLRKTVGAALPEFTFDEGIVLDARGGTQAVITVTNHRMPVTLVVRARNIGPGGFDEFEFAPRTLAAGGCAEYTLALLSDEKLWAGEHLDRIQEPPAPTRRWHIWIALTIQSLSETSNSTVLCTYLVSILPSDGRLKVYVQRAVRDGNSRKVPGTRDSG